MKKFFFVFLCLISFIFTNECFATQKNQKIEYQNNILSIKINKLRPDGIKEKKIEAFKVLKPYLNKNLLNASVTWQEDDFSHGVTVAIPKTYINQYLRRQLNKENFINKFHISYIEPEKIIVKNNKCKIIPEKTREANSLREHADVFRHHNDNEAALRTYLQALEINPCDCVSLYRVTQIYKETGDFELAEDYLYRIQKLNPSFADWVNGRVER